MRVSKVHTSIIISCLLSYLIISSLGVKVTCATYITTFLLLIIARKSPLAAMLVFLFEIFSAIYYPTGVTFGSPNSGYIASLLLTDRRESYEFLKQFNVMIWLTVAAFLVFSFIMLKLRSRRKNHPFWFVSFFIIISVSFIPSYAKNIYHDYKGVKENIDQLRIDQNPTFKIYDKGAPKQTIIVIIGESLRRDYMSLYGYNEKTTPFLDSVNGVFIDGYTSAAPNTIYTLTRTLTRSDGKDIHPGDNIVSLFNDAGYSTHWISNQGVYGKYDSGISQIALKAKNVRFMKSSEYSSGKNIDDFAMLPALKSALTDRNDKKIIFIHMMGSHPYACDRLFDYNVKYHTGKGRNFDCYLETINKTDLFIKKVFELAKEQGHFSLVYFSDHGMSIDDKNEKGPQIHVGNQFKQNYQIPLVLLSDSINNRTYIKKGLSAFHFMDLLSNYVGIRTNYTDKSFNFLNYPQDNDLKVFNWVKMVSYQSLAEQPPL